MTPPLDDPAEVFRTMQQEALNYMRRGVQLLGHLPEHGFFLALAPAHEGLPREPHEAVAPAEATGAITMGVVADWASIAPALQRAAQAPVTAVVLVFPYRTKATIAAPVRRPRVGLISALEGQAPTLDAYVVDASPLAPPYTRLGLLSEDAPHLVPPSLTLWGVVYEAPVFSGLPPATKS